MSKESYYPMPMQWTRIRPLHGRLDALPVGVHPVADRDDIAIAMLGIPSAPVVIERHCPHRAKDLTRFGLVNVTTCVLSCAHLRYMWALPSGAAALGADVTVFSHTLLDGDLWAYLPIRAAS